MMGAMRPRFRWTRLLAVVVLAAVVAAGVPAVRRFLMRAAGHALVIDEPVTSADVIVLPQWAGAAGAIEAADLVHAGIAGQVAFLAEPTRPAERELARRGVPNPSDAIEAVRRLHALGVANVELIADPAAGTESEGQVLLAWCRQRQCRSIVVVSSADHSRRVRRVLHRSLRGEPATVTIRSARYSTFEPDSWWTTRDGARTEIVELQKLILDVLRHPLS
jgi:hypothetical protein